MGTRGLQVCALFVGFAIASPAVADPIRIATWNLNNLHHETGKALRSRAPKRSKEDFAVLRRYRDRLDADVIALQEVNGPKAARRVFPAKEWDLYFSGRHAQDLEKHGETRDIYVGFAVRKGTFDAVYRFDVPALGIVPGVRWGLEIVVRRGKKRLRILGVHLKSGCFGGDLHHPRGKSCPTLSRQRAPLEKWIDRAATQKIPFVLLGDFNRKFDCETGNCQSDDAMWRDLDDHEPAELDLFRVPYRRESTCWKGQKGRHHRNPIDFIIFDKRAWEWVDRGSFKQLDYDAADRQSKHGLPSDHCPISIDVAF